MVRRQPTAIGNGMTVLKRSTPSIVNTAFNNLQMWDGRFGSLEEQALGPMQAPGEMNGSIEQILTKLKSIPGYVRAFEKAYSGEGISSRPSPDRRLELVRGRKRASACS